MSRFKHNAMLGGGFYIGSSSGRLGEKLINMISSFEIPVSFAPDSGSENDSSYWDAKVKLIAHE